MVVGGCIGLGHVVALEAKKRSQWSFLANDTVNIITHNVSLLGSDQIRSGYIPKGGLWNGLL